MKFKSLLGGMLAGGILVGGQALAAEDVKNTRAVEKNEVTAKNDDSKYQKLEERIEARLEKDKGLKDHRIDVDIHDGKVVLKGEVDTVAERTRAGRIARRSGAKLLDNQLTVDGDGAAVKTGAMDGDSAEERADKAKDRIEDKADKAKDNVEKKAEADKERIEKNAEKAKNSVDRNVETAK